MASVFGKNLVVSIFGQSHSEAIGIVIDGLPAGFEIDMDELQEFMNRRAPGRSKNATQRKEADKPEFLSGLFDGLTCGAPLAAIIRNKDVRSQDYDQIDEMPRPGHADLTARIKYNGFEDYRGGGHFSGRLTAPLCIAGGIAIQFLREEGIEFSSKIVELGGVDLRPFYDAENSSANCSEGEGQVKKKLSMLNSKKTAATKKTTKKAEKNVQDVIDELISSAKKEGDSIGGIVECRITGVPAGIGDPMFDGVENRISQAVFGIPAIKGIEFGAGFDAARMKGSENNDAYLMDDVSPDGASSNDMSMNDVSLDEGVPYDQELGITGRGGIITKTNNAGGILGGITNGQDIVFRVAVKPTPSIAKEQDTINYFTGENAKIKVKGRHDPCIVPRVLPCLEAAAAIVVLDYML